MCLFMYIRWSASNRVSHSRPTWLLWLYAVMATLDHRKSDEWIQKYDCSCWHRTLCNNRHSPKFHDAFIVSLYRTSTLSLVLLCLFVLSQTVLRQRRKGAVTIATFPYLFWWTVTFFSVFPAAFLSACPSFPSPTLRNGKVCHGAADLLSTMKG